MATNTAIRADGRSSSELRPISIKPGVSPYAEGSAEVTFGNTKVLICASVELETPRWMEEGSGGWITAEYGMLPRSTHTRSRREAAAGKQEGRTLEIQRLIGRALRAAVDLSVIKGITIRLDCDVLVADGGTRTAAISGGWVALSQALTWVERKGLLPGTALSVEQIAAISVGVVDGQEVIDLPYVEDSQADFDLNIVCNSKQELIEIQGTGERKGIALPQLQRLTNLALQGCAAIMEEQRRALAQLG